MARGKTIDRVALHCDLWSKSDRLNRIEIYQKELAQTLGVTQATMSLIIKDLVEDGRVRKIASKPRNVGIYVVRDPAQFEHTFDGQAIFGFPNLERGKLCGALFAGGPHSPRTA